GNRNPVSGFETGFLSRLGGEETRFPKQKPGFETSADGKGGRGRVMAGPERAAGGGRGGATGGARPVHRRRPAAARGGDGLQPVRPGQAAASAAGGAGVRGGGRGHGGRPAGGVCGGDGSHVLADPRRPAGDGRRR